MLCDDVGERLGSCGGSSTSIVAVIANRTKNGVGCPGSADVLVGFVLSHADGDVGAPREVLTWTQESKRLHFNF